MIKLFVNIACMVAVALTFSAVGYAGALDKVSEFFRKSPSQKAPTIKVLIVHDRPGVLLEVKGKYKIFDPNTGKHIATRFQGKRKFIQGLKEGLRWSEDFPGVYQIMIFPDENATTVLVDGVEYRGPIFVYDIGGTISVVNEVSIEDYLSATLANRYKLASNELLNAIVIASRTTAYYRVENPKSSFFAVDGASVGYQGQAAIDPSSNIEKAIKATRYMVMTNTMLTTDKIVPFASEWKQEGMTSPPLAEVLTAKITLSEAASMAQQGKNAADILSKAYTGVKIELLHYSPEDVLKKK